MSFCRYARLAQVLHRSVLCAKARLSLLLKRERGQAMDGTTQSNNRSAITHSVLLICCVLVITLATGVSLARFNTGASAPQHARVAKFGLSVLYNNQIIGGDFFNVTSHPEGGNKTYDFTVRNDSEVAVRAQFHALSINSNTTPVFNPASTFDLAPGASRVVSVTITDSLPTVGNHVRMHVTYEQID